MAPASSENSGREASAGNRTCAVIYNPTKVPDDFVDVTRARLDDAGWHRHEWLPTREDDPGREMAGEAISHQVDLVIVAGGDGTVRAVAGELAGESIPLGIVPAGTGNLLARNLELPLDTARALEVALGSERRAIDMVELTIDERDPERFAVMAGVGLDAMIMDVVDPKLKSAIGSAAYFVAARKAMGRLPMKVDISVDGQRARRRDAMLCVIGNVGDLTGGITLIPGAAADDGFLHVYVASPQRPTHWVKVLARLVTRRPSRDDQVDMWHGQRVHVELNGPDKCQIDGDVAGECRVLSAVLLPRALTVCVEADPGDSSDR